MPVRDGASCPGCGLPNYDGLCPVCRGDEQGYVDELQFAFGPWHADEVRSPDPSGGVVGGPQPDQGSAPTKNVGRAPDGSSEA